MFAGKTQQFVVLPCTLLDRVRKGAKTSSKGEKRKIDKEHCIQVRWLHYNRDTKTFDSVLQKNGEGNRYIAYNASAPPNLNDLKIKASNVFFSEGKSVFAGPVDNMVLSICDITQTAIFDFPNHGTLDDFLKEKGMYLSTTYLFQRSQPKDTIDSEFEEDNFLQVIMNTVDSACEAGSTSCINNVSPASQYSTVCVNCSCMFIEGDICLNSNQNNDFEKHLDLFLFNLNAWTLLEIALHQQLHRENLWFVDHTLEKI